MAGAPWVPCPGWYTQGKLRFLRTAAAAGDSVSRAGPWREGCSKKTGGAKQLGQGVPCQAAHPQGARGLSGQRGQQRLSCLGGTSPENGPDSASVLSASP